MLVLRTHSSVKVCALEHWAYWDLDDGWIWMNNIEYILNTDVLACDDFTAAWQHKQSWVIPDLKRGYDTAGANREDQQRWGPLIIENTPQNHAKPVNLDMFWRNHCDGCESKWINMNRNLQEFAQAFRDEPGSPSAGGSDCFSQWFTCDDFVLKRCCTKFLPVPVPRSLQQFRASGHVPDSLWGGLMCLVHLSDNQDSRISEMRTGWTYIL